MPTVKMPTSRSYHEFLIETLQNWEETAGYIQVNLEEGGDEAKLGKLIEWKHYLFMQFH